MPILTKNVSAVAQNRQYAGSLRARNLIFLTMLLVVTLGCPMARGVRPFKNAQGEPIETEIAVQSGTSFGNYVVFGYEEGRSIDPLEVEYDAHLWGSFLKARVDYVAEVIPVMFLDEPAKYGLDTLAEGPERQFVYGGGIYPTGARFLWRRDKKFRPFLIGQGGILYFQRRIESPEGAKLNYSGKFGIGAEERLSPRFDLRLGYNDFHISNGDTAPHNPGVDMMYFFGGVSMRLGRSPSR